MEEIEVKGNKKIIKAWVLYDWANSVYPLIISSAIFPILFETKTSIKDKISGKTIYDTISFFGFEFKNTEFYAYLICLSYIVVAILSPIFSGIADAGGRRKLFMQIFCYTGALSSGLLYFFNADNHGVDYTPFELGISILPLFIASIGFWGSLVYYNSYLPEIADYKDHDKISARGFSMGYLGSSILLIIILVLTVFTKTIPIKFAFPLVSVWWIAFASYSFYYLPKTKIPEVKKSGNILSSGFKELASVFRNIQQNKILKRFLSSYFMYNMAVQTIMVMAVAFANKEIIGIKSADLIISILIIQFLGIAGAFLMSKLSSRIGNIKTIGLAILIWIGLCLAVYSLVYKPWQFYIAAAVVGLVMGGIQSVSRSTYAKLLPETNDLTSYFSFFDMAEKIGLAIGTLTFGVIEGYLDIRSSILALVIFFVSGFLLLLLVPHSERLGHRARKIADR